MIIIKNKRALETMITAGQLLAEIFEAMTAFIGEGVSALDLDTWIAIELKKRNLVSQSKGYMGYKHVSCISLNDEVVHGIPMAHKKFVSGDLIKVDVCAAWNGYCADMARCFFVGTPPSEVKKLVEVAYQSLDKGIEQAVAGKRIGDISAAVQYEVERHGFGIVRDFAGHGIGKSMHEEPEILNYGKAGTGPVIRVGMAFAIEPMITAGNYTVKVLADGWTATTVDKSLAAHVEDTVIVTDHGPKIITRL